jgi:hypothetical protein
MEIRTTNGCEYHESGKRRLFYISDPPLRSGNDEKFLLQIVCIQVIWVCFLSQHGSSHHQPSQSISSRLYQEMGEKRRPHRSPCISTLCNPLRGHPLPFTVASNFRKSLVTSGFSLGHGSDCGPNCGLDDIQRLSSAQKKVDHRHW